MRQETFLLILYLGKRDLTAPLYSSIQEQVPSR